MGLKSKGKMSPPEAQIVLDPLPDFTLRRRSIGLETCRLGADAHKGMELKGMHQATDPAKVEGSGWALEGTCVLEGTSRDGPTRVHVTDDREGRSGCSRPIPSRPIPSGSLPPQASCGPALPFFLSGETDKARSCQ